MEKMTLSIALSDSLKDETTACITELAEVGLDSIMDKIQDLSNEFDKYDLDHNKYIDFDEYKNFITQNLFISE